MMPRKAFDNLNKAKKQEASARATKRRVVASMNKEYGALVRKYFPELDATKKVDGEVVPVVDDVEKFLQNVADIYHEYDRIKDEPGSKFWNLVATGKIWR